MSLDDRPQWQHLKVTQDCGVTEVTLHDGMGNSLIWNAAIHHEIAELCVWLSFDRSTKVLLLTGAGEWFCAEIDSSGLRDIPFREIWREGQRLLCGLLDLEVLTIAVVNGPALIHSEIAVIADIVLACPEAEFADLAHFSRNVVPADGVHTVWSNLLGPSRASYFLLTGERISAANALQLGVVHEIHPRETLYERARSLACTLAAKPGPLLTYTRAALRIRDRRNFREDLSHGLALEGLAMFAQGLRGPEKGE